MATPARNNHASSVQIQEPRTRSPLPPSPIAFKEQQGRPPPTTQQTITGKLFRNLFKGLLFSQLTLTSLLVIVLTIRGLILASSHHFHPKKWYPPLLASVAVSGVASLTWQCIFIYNPSRAVRATFWLSPILTCSVGILLVLIGSAVDAGVGAVFVLFAITQSLYGCWITPRLEYTDKILSLSTAFPPPRTREVVTLSIVISVVYSGFLVTGIGGATSTRTNLDLLFISVILIGLAWTMQVLKNAQQVAISRARYVNFAHGEDMDAWSALHVTVKHLIGSICIGSTLVPVIVLIRGSIRSVNLMSGSSDEVMYSGADCFSSLANKVVTCGNRWGFVHVGTYDKGFVEASSDTWLKFRSVNGLEKVIDSDLSSSLCFLSAVSVGSVSSLTAGIWMLLIHKDYALEVTLYAFIIGYFTGMVALAWLQACVSAYYVAYSEDPHSMRFDGLTEITGRGRDKRLMSLHEIRYKHTVDSIDSKVRFNITPHFFPIRRSKLCRSRNFHSGGGKLCSLSLLPASRFSVRALVRPDVVSEDGGGDSGALSFPNHISVKIPFGNREILVETGLMGRQASSSVTVTDGETIVCTSVCVADVPSEPSDFLPLYVHYQERFSAVGRTSGGFFKREGKTKDHEVLICRLIDRPLRPTMPKGFYNETQILSWVLSYDGLHAPDALAVTSAGIAVALSEVPNAKAIAGVRVGLIGGEFIVNPTVKELEESQLDLFLAGTDTAILTIEGYSNFLPEEMLLQAVKIGQDAVQATCTAIEALAKKHGKAKMVDAIRLPPPDLYKHVKELAGEELSKALQIKGKIPRRKAISSLEEKVLTVMTEKGYVVDEVAFGTTEAQPELLEDEDEDEEVVPEGEVDQGDVHIRPIPRKPIPLLFSEVDVKLVFKEVSSKLLRRRIVEGGKRSDGRTPDGIRPIDSRCGLLPRAHGSSLFTRGETQALAVVTLGDKQMAQRIDNLEGSDEYKRFYLQYTFPPSSVGEVGRIGAPSRREIGHGTLAERALETILPSDDDFPYTIRVESTILESNGSSSMASVCGGCLALQDAGVPVKCSVAGIAMGMVWDTEEFGGDGSPLILSDITGAEDASGDMDFKVAGNEDGVTAFQMDIKVGGITLEIMEKALIQAKAGRRHILAEMAKCSPPPTLSLSKYAPLIHIMKVHPSKVYSLIGSGGKKVKSIIEESGVEAIDMQDDGIVKIMANNVASLERAKAIISGLTMVPAVGDIYRNCEIKSMAPYGAFVEIAPGREGLCHVSELSAEWLAKPEDAYKIGDRIDVKLIEVNEKGQLRLSVRALLPESESGKDSQKPPPAGDSTKDKGSPRKYVNTSSKDRAATKKIEAA
ncbi:unnamed protein product [Brassica napus]|uniref:polyribonucleotide nucleotidyltransferase n=1 Tax=Brassica napus TaxID=3708 RepID=A0A816U136_BRANA|nr:unnamed protein product [Brassica napus]